MAGFDDVSRFFLADIGRTRQVAVTDAGALTDQLEPGRYLVQVLAISDEDAVVWFRPRAHSADAIGITAAAPAMPLSKFSGVLVVETHARVRHSDQFQFRTTTGITATVCVTRVSLL